MMNLNIQETTIKNIRKKKNYDDYDYNMIAKEI